MVGFLADEKPMLLQLEGRQDSSEFWSQQEVLDLLRIQTLAAVSETIPVGATVVPPLPRQVSQPRSFFGRRTSKLAEVKASTVPTPVAVDVQRYEAYFRADDMYGLPQTLGVQTLKVTVVV